MGPVIILGGLSLAVGARSEFAERIVAKGLGISVGARDPGHHVAAVGERGGPSPRDRLRMTVYCPSN